MSNNHSEPTFENQLWHARKLIEDKGTKELQRHAAVGKMCGCGGCFCCAALHVLHELRITD